MTSRRPPGAHVSEAWAEWRRRVDLDAYESRFAHDTAHGEADFITTMVPAPTSVLDAGCGTGRLAAELHRRGLDVAGVDLDDDLLAIARRKQEAIEWACADLATLQLGRRFDAAVMAGNVLLFSRVEDRAAIVRRCASHLGPGGRLVAGFSLHGVGEPLGLADYDSMAATAGLDLVERWATWDRQPYDGGPYAVSVHAIRPVG